MEVKSSKPIKSLEDSQNLVQSFITKEPSSYNYRLIFSEKSEINNLKKEGLALKKRNLFENKNFFEKKLIAFELLFKNQYKYFNGLRSFLRDLIR